MPDLRAVNALSIRRAGVRERLQLALRRGGYDPATLDALPDPGECGCELAQAIHAWRAVNEQLDAAQAATHGWRY